MFAGTEFLLADNAVALQITNVVNILRFAFEDIETPAAEASTLGHQHAVAVTFADFHINADRVRPVFEVGCSAFRDTSHPIVVGVVRDTLGDYYLLYAESVLRLLSGSGYQAKRIHVLRQHPEKELYDRHFGKADIKPGHESVRLFSDLEVLDRRFSHYNPQLSTLIRDSADQRLKWLESEQKSLGGRVKTRLLTQLGVEDVSADTMAADLGFSRATFFRRLREEGTSFQKILDEVRHDSAVRLLLGSKWEWHEVGDMLGFPNSNHFRRFFQKYEAMSPRAYRLRYRDA